jgi:hypothetical protein
MSTSETPAEAPSPEGGPVPAPAVAPAAGRKPVGFILGGIAAAIVLFALGFGVGWFSRRSTEPDLAKLRGLRRALGVMPAVELLGAVRRMQRGSRRATPRMHYLCQPPVPPTARTTTMPRDR